MTRLVKQPKWRAPRLGEWLAGVKDEVAWLIPGLVPKSGIVLISGQQKLAFKTFLSDALSLLVSTGVEYGRMTATLSGPVVYVEEEGQGAQTRDRLVAVAEGLGVDPQDAEVYYIFRQRVKLDSELWAKRILDLVREVKPVLLILDAMVYLHGADENKTHEMKPVVELLQEVREMGASVLCLAHLNSAGSDPNKDIDEQVRGSKIIVNAYDTHLALRRRNRKDPIKLTARHRGAPEREYKIFWELDLDDDILTKATPTLEQVDDEAETMDRLEKALMYVNPAVEYTMAALKQTMDLPHKETAKFVKLAVSIGRMVQLPNGKYRGVPKEVSK